MRVVVELLIEGTRGDSVAKRVQCGSEGGLWSGDEGVSSSASREGNVCNDALHIIGLRGPGDKISLFLKDWELARLALSCRSAPGHAADAGSTFKSSA